jgi:hypothetical protein
MTILKDVLYDPDPDGQTSGTDSGTGNLTETGDKSNNDPGTADPNPAAD